jgi:hypothetical protein
LTFQLEVANVRKDGDLSAGWEVLVGSLGDIFFTWKMVGWATQARKRCAEIEDSMDKMGFNLKNGDGMKI